MTKKEKIILKFIDNPELIKYKELENILLDLWFIKINAKWSHIKLKHKLFKNDIIIPIHNNDCKWFYKKQILKILINNNLLWE